MKTLKICIIDEPLNLNVLRELVPCVPENITVIQRENAEGEMFRISHGTLCTALLIEALTKYKILDQVEITHISIADDAGEKSFPAVMEALEHCAEQETDLVSMSVGMVTPARAKDMYPVLERLDHTVVVAAASNRFALTFPAAIPQVIGVKRSMRPNGIEIDRISSPLDGIEIIADLPETEVLRRFYARCNLSYRRSNSELVPQLCARIAVKALHNDKVLTKEFALDCLKTSSRAIKVSDYSYIIPLNDDDKIPVVILPYAEDDQMAFDLARTLQKEFEANDYSCAILSEAVEKSDFIEGWYRLDAAHQKRCYGYYQDAVAEGVLLALIKNDRLKGLKGDLILKNWMEKILCGNIREVYLTILENF